MPRRAPAQPRRIEPDPVHRNRLVQQVINKVMLDGKKSVSEKIVYDALAIIAERSGKNPVEQLEAGVKALTPVLEVRSRRVGGATYQVPMEVRKERSFSLGIRWLVGNARSRGGKSFRDKLVGEILDAYTEKGGAMKKRETVHKMAESNRAFAHYRW
jgi:small subunit ribosomal protein S7